MADSPDKLTEKPGGGTDIETKKLLSLSLSMSQMWALAGICATAIGGPFGLGVFVQKATSDRSSFGQGCSTLCALPGCLTVS